MDQDRAVDQIWQEHRQVTRRVWGQGLSLAGHLDGVVGFTKTHEGEWCPCGQGVGMKRVWPVASEHEIHVETRQ